MDGYEEDSADAGGYQAIGYSAAVSYVNEMMVLDGEVWKDH